MIIGALTCSNSRIQLASTKGYSVHPDRCFPPPLPPKGNTSKWHFQTTLCTMSQAAHTYSFSTWTNPERVFYENWLRTTFKRKSTIQLQFFPEGSLSLGRHSWSYPYSLSSAPLTHHLQGWHFLFCLCHVSFFFFFTKKRPLIVRYGTIPQNC